MPHSPATAIEAIQAILAPALGISAVGLLLLGLYNRYSNIINRIRSLNEERRRYMKLIADDKDLGYTDNIRFISITDQGKELLMRSRFVRNAILCLQLAIGLFVLTSVMIAASLFVASEFVETLSLFFFVTGMLSVILGVFWAGVDVHRSYKIVLLESNLD